MKFISRVEQANLTRSLCSLMRYPGQYSYFSPHIHVLLSISIYSHIHVVFMSLMEIILLGAIKQEFNGGGTRVCAKSTRSSTEIINRCGEWFLQKFTTNRVMAINPTSIHLLEKIYITL